MSELLPEDFAMAEMVVKSGFLPLGKIYQALKEFSSLADDKEPSSVGTERFGPYLVQHGLMSVQELYELSRDMVPKQFWNDNGPAPGTELAEQILRRDRTYAIVLSSLDDEDIKDRAMQVLRELREIDKAEAAHLCRYPVIPVLTRLLKEEAEIAKMAFVEAQVPCRLVKWRKPESATRMSSQRASSRRNLKVQAGQDGDSILRDASRILSSSNVGIRPGTGRYRFEMSPQDSVNPFEKPVDEPDPLINTDSVGADSVGADSVDFLVVGSSESNVIFLDGPTSDNTATAITVFTNSDVLKGEVEGKSGGSSASSESESETGKGGRVGLGSTVAGYSLTKMLGKGGFAKVYLGEHQVLGHKAAIKVYKTRDARLLRRVTRREAALISRLRHPRIVSILNVGQEAGSFFIVMEYIQGQSLGQYVKENGPLSIRHAIEVAQDIAEALNYLHRNGLVHRDVKPSNFLLEPSGHVRLLDFELVKSYLDPLTRIDNEAITQSGQLIGTPRFMSPEQIDNARNLEPPSDVYSLGVSLYYVVTGRYPFTGKSLVQVVKQVLIKDPVKPSIFTPLLPERMENLMLRMLSKEANQRPEIHQVMAELEEILKTLGHDSGKVGSGDNAMEFDKDDRDWQYLPSDTVVIAQEDPDSGEHLKLGDDTQGDMEPAAHDEEDHLDSTIVGSDYAIGKIDNSTFFGGMPNIEEEPEVVQYVRRWNDLRAESEKEAVKLLSALPQDPRRMHSELAAVTEWRDFRKARKHYEKAVECHRRRQNIEALYELSQALIAMPEYKDAQALRAQLETPLPVNMTVVRERAKSGQAVLYAALAEVLEGAVKEDRIEHFLDTYGCGLTARVARKTAKLKRNLPNDPEARPKSLLDFLHAYPAAVWLLKMFQNLCDRSKLREIALSLELKPSRRASKRRIIALILEHLGFNAEAIARP